MKRKNFYRADFFVGKWELEGTYEVDRPGRRKPKWIYLSKIEPGAIIWQFDGRIRHTAYKDGEIDYETRYLFKPEAKEFFIDISYLDFVTAGHRYIDNYRVDIRSENEIWLYSLDDVCREPQGYWFAYRLKRI